MKLSNAANIQSMIFATVIALLVWVFAEGETLSSRSVLVTASFPTDPAATLVIRPEDPNFTGQVRVRLEGTTRTLDAAAVVVSSRGGVGAGGGAGSGGGGGGIRIVPGMPGVPTEPGEKRVVDLREVINALPEFQNLGSTVAEVEPRQVVVTVVKMAVREVPVRVELSSTDPALVPTLDGEATPAQPTVQLRLSERAMAALPEGGGGATAVVVVSESELRRIRSLGEGPVSVTGAVRPPTEVAGLTSGVGGVSPENMTVTLRVKRKVETLSMPSVPVWFALPPTEDPSRWSITLEKKFITQVTLTGTAEQLAGIKSGQVGVKALIELSSEDLEKPGTSKTATFPGLPAGVTATATDLSVGVKVTKRAG